MRRYPLAVRTPEDIEALLRRILRGDDVPPAATIDSNALTDASAYHGLDHVVLPWLRTIAPEHQALVELTRRQRAAALFHARTIAALRLLLAALPIGTPVAVLKGPVLAELTRFGGIRAYGDLDLLVDPHDLPAVVGAAETIGAQLFPFGSWHEWLGAGSGQIPVDLPFGITLDLHWSLLSQPEPRRAFAVDPAAELLRRATSLDIGAERVPVLGAEDLVLHTAAHAAWSGGERLGWLVDIDATIFRYEGAAGGAGGGAVWVSRTIDWDVVMRRVTAWGLAPLVTDMLARSAAALGWTLPEEVRGPSRGLRIGRGAGLDGLLRFAPRLDGLASRRPEYAPSRLLRIDARPSLPGTLAVLMRRTGRAVRRRVAPDLRPIANRAGHDLVDPRGSYLAFAAVEGDPLNHDRRVRRAVLAGSFGGLARTLPLAVRCRSQLAQVRDLHDLLRGLDRWADAHPRRRSAAADLVRTTNWSLRVLRADDPSCVLRSLVLYTALRAQSHEASFVRGVDGHAWVQSRALPLILTGDVGASAAFKPGFVHPPVRP